MGTIETYSRATVVMTGEKRTAILIGTVDRIKTKVETKKTWEQANKAGEGEEWISRSAYHAYKREVGTGLSYEEWLENFVGLEYAKADDTEEGGDEGEGTPAE